MSAWQHSSSTVNSAPIVHSGCGRASCAPHGGEPASEGILLFVGRLWIRSFNTARGNLKLGSFCLCSCFSSRYSNKITTHHHPDLAQDLTMSVCPKCILDELHLRGPVFNRNHFSNTYLTRSFAVTLTLTLTHSRSHSLPHPPTHTCTHKPCCGGGPPISPGGAAEQGRPAASAVEGHQRAAGDPLPGVVCLPRSLLQCGTVLQNFLHFLRYFLKQMGTFP